MAFWLLLWNSECLSHWACPPTALSSTPWSPPDRHPVPSRAPPYSRMISSLLTTSAMALFAIRSHSKVPRVRILTCILGRDSIQPMRGDSLTVAGKHEVRSWEFQNPFWTPSLWRTRTWVPSGLSGQNQGCLRFRCCWKDPQSWGKGWTTLALARKAARRALLSLHYRVEKRKLHLFENR